MYKINPLTQQRNVLIKNSTTKNLNKTSLILVYEKKPIHINKSYYYDIMSKSETYLNLLIFRYKTRHIVP